MAHDIVVAGQLAASTNALAVLPAGLVHLKGRSTRQPLHIIVDDEAAAQRQTFRSLQKEHSHITARLGKLKGSRKNQSIQQLLDELSLHHPNLESYLKTLPSRQDDFAN